MTVDRSKQHAEYNDNWALKQEDFNIIQNSCSLIHKPIVLDIAASKENKKCIIYFTKQDDALKQDWYTGHDMFLNGSYQGFYYCNPPYSLKEDFLKKAHEQLEKGNEGIFLLPNSAETSWYREYILYPNLPRMVFPRRIQFIDPRPPEPGKKKRKGNTGASVLVAFVKEGSALPEIRDKNGIIQPWVVNREIVW